MRESNTRFSFTHIYRSLKTEQPYLRSLFSFPAHRSTWSSSRILNSPLSDLLIFLFLKKLNSHIVTFLFLLNTFSPRLPQTTSNLIYETVLSMSILETRKLPVIQLCYWSFSSIRPLSSTLYLIHHSLHSVLSYLIQQRTLPSMLMILNFSYHFFNDA